MLHPNNATEKKAPNSYKLQTMYNTSAVENCGTEIEAAGLPAGG